MAYEKQGGKDLIQRDELAVERTKLAEERTYLAYIRTGMSVLLAGLFFIGYFMEGSFHYLGYATAAIGLAFLAYGFYNHKKSMEVIGKASLGLIKINKGDGDD
jgi:putative membrane protein